MSSLNTKRQCYLTPKNTPRAHTGFYTYITTPTLDELNINFDDIQNIIGVDDIALEFIGLAFSEESKYVHFIVYTFQVAL